jgi:hypothetical protein
MDGHSKYSRIMSSNPNYLTVWPLLMTLTQRPSRDVASLQNCFLLSPMLPEMHIHMILAQSAQTSVKSRLK